MVLLLIKVAISQDASKRPKIRDKVNVASPNQFSALVDEDGLPLHDTAPGSLTSLRLSYFVDCSMLFPGLGSVVPAS